MLGSLLESLEAEVVLLQETHFTSLHEAKVFESRIGVKGVFSFGSSRSRGVAVVFTRRFQGRVTRQTYDYDGRIVSVDVCVRGKDLRLVTVYAPTEYQERNIFFRQLDPYLMGKRDIILGGDFNCVLDDVRDRTGGTHRNQPWKSAELRRLLKARELEDAWTYKHGATPGFTFSAGARHVRLDRYYLSKSVLSFLRDCSVVQVGTSANFFSDHRAVLLDIRETVGFGQQPAFWRLNLSLLKDDRVVADLMAFLRSKTGDRRSLEWWDDLKDGVRKILQSWGRRLAREQRQEMKLLQVGLRGLLEGGLSSSEEVLAFRELQAELSALLYQKSRGWMTRGEEASLLRTGYSTGLQTAGINPKRSPTVRIERLVRADGTTAETLDELVDTCQLAYERLFSARTVDTSLWEEVCGQYPSLTTAQSGDLDLEITVGELFRAAKCMRKRKAPGPDGLPVEFYLRFWEILGPVLCDVFAEAVDRGVLPPSSRCGLVKLLCKDPDRREHLAAWRPVTLLNTDYKLFAKVIQRRLSTVMDMLISPAQGSSVSGRGVQQHLSALRDVFYWTADRRTETFFLSIDQEKAFDRVSHDFLWFVLQRAGFGDEFQRLVRVLYSDAESRVLVNGRPSSAFKVQSGVRQGCPLSPLLYVLVFEAAVRMMSEPRKVPRLPLPGSDRFATLFAYADDLTVCLPEPRAIEAVLDCLDKYSRASGARINQSKSSVMAVGRDFPYSEVYGIPVRESCRILGILFNARGPLISNWGIAIRDMEARLRSFATADLNFRERAVAVSRHVCSRLWYFGQAFQPANATARRANRLNFTFFWDGHPERVQRAIMMRPPQMGGWSFPDVLLYCAALGLANIFSILRDEHHVSHDLAIFFAGTAIRDFGGSFDNIRPHAAHLPTYYRLMRTHAMRLHRQHPDSDFTTWTVRQLYQALCDVSHPIQDPQHDRRLLTCLLIESNRVDVLWQHQHEVLPVRERLRRLRISRTDACRACGDRETHQHVFFNCINAAAMWRKVASAFGIPTIGYETVKYFDPIPVPTRKRPAFLLLCAEVCYQLWAARTRSVYGASTGTLVGVVQACRIALHARLQRELRAMGLEAFRGRWKVHHNVFLLVRGKIVIKF